MLSNKINDLINSKPEVFGKSMSFAPMFESGLSILDYRNGFYNTELDVERIGLMGGKITSFIGPSSSGKTTYAIQAAATIARNFTNSNIIHYDFEDATTDERIYQITGFNKEEFKNKYTKLNTDISLESVDKLIRGIRDVKKQNPDDFMYETDKIGEDGKPIRYMVPTIVIIDSVATMASAEIDDKDGEGGQMDATKQAKHNTAFIKRIVGSSTLNSANIMLFLVNHITTKIDINPYQKTAKPLNYLKEGEALPGGVAINYMANNMFKITAGSALDGEGNSNQAKYGVKGYISNIDIIKSRSNSSGVSFKAVMIQKSGFSNELTNLLYLQENKMLKGSPRAYFIEGMEDVKFTLKTFLSKIEENKEFAKYFDKYMRTIYKEKFLEEISYEGQLEEKMVGGDEEEFKLIECVNEEDDIWLGSDGKYYDSGKNEIEVVEE